MDEGLRAARVPPMMSYLWERTLSSSPSSDQAVPRLPWWLSRFDVNRTEIRWGFRHRRRRRDEAWSWGSTAKAPLGNVGRESRDGWGTHDRWKVNRHGSTCQSRLLGLDPVHINTPMILIHFHPLAPDTQREAYHCFLCIGAACQPATRPNYEHSKNAQVLPVRYAPKQSATFWRV